MNFLDSDTLLFLLIILLFLGFFLWNRNRHRKNRDLRKGRNFRKGYEERKREKEQWQEDDTRGPNTPPPPD